MITRKNHHRSAADFILHPGFLWQKIQYQCLEHINKLTLFHTMKVSVPQPPYPATTSTLPAHSHSALLTSAASQHSLVARALSFSSPLLLESLVSLSLSLVTLCLYPLNQHDTTINLTSRPRIVENTKHPPRTSNKAHHKNKQSTYSTW